MSSIYYLLRTLSNLRMCYQLSDRPCRETRGEQANERSGQRIDEVLYRSRHDAGKLGFYAFKAPQISAVLVDRRSNLIACQLSFYAV
jgi:hypothetical protein